MGCLLKLPFLSSKGVVTFTTPEWSLIKKNSRLLSQLQNLRTE